MKVVEVDYDTKTGNFILWVGPESFLVDYDSFERLGLGVDVELDMDDIRELKRIDDYLSARDLAIKYASRRMTSSHKLEEYLRRKGIEDTEEIIQETKKLGLIDDQAYLRAYIQDKKNLSGFSKRRIGYDLSTMGFDSQDLLILDDLYLDEEEVELALSQAQQRFRTLKERDYKAKNRVYGYLYRKAYQTSTIESVLRKMGF